MACQSIEMPEKPKTLIPEDKMVNILTDIAFVKAAKGSYKKVFDIEKINPETYILEKHGVDSLIFAQNNEWYTGQLEKYEVIFTKVRNNLETSKNLYEKMQKKEDSIKKIKDSIENTERIPKNPKFQIPENIREEMNIEELEEVP